MLLEIFVNFAKSKVCRMEYCSVRLCGIVAVKGDKKVVVVWHKVEDENEGKRRREVQMMTCVESSIDAISD